MIDDASGGVVSGLLDFEFVAYDWRVMELAVALSKYVGEDAPLPLIRGERGGRESGRGRERESHIHQKGGRGLCVWLLLWRAVGSGLLLAAGGRTAWLLLCCVLAGPQPPHVVPDMHAHTCTCTQHTLTHTRAHSKHPPLQNNARVCVGLRAARPPDARGARGASGLHQPQVTTNPKP